MLNNTWLCWYAQMTLLKYCLQIEYIVVKFNDQEKTTKLSLRAFDILEKLSKPEHDWLEGTEKWVLWV